MPENQFFERKGPFPLGEIVKVIGCSGNFSKESNFIIRGFESLDNASNNDMTFLNSSKYQELSLKTKAAACITSPNFSKFLPKKCIKLDVKNVLFAVTKASKMFYPKADIDYPLIVQHLPIYQNRENPSEDQLQRQILSLEGIVIT